MSKFSNANRSIEFMLQSCPALKRFEIEGSIDEPQDDGVLQFDFSHLKQLKHIKVYISGLPYYQLDVPAKKKLRWLDVNTPLIDSLDDNRMDDDSMDDDSMDDDESSNANDYKFYIYLKWSQKNAPSIKLRNPRNGYAMQ